MLCSECDEKGYVIEIVNQTYTDPTGEQVAYDCPTCHGQFRLMGLNHQARKYQEDSRDRTFDSMVDIAFEQNRSLDSVIQDPIGNILDRTLAEVRRYVIRCHKCDNDLDLNQLLDLHPPPTIEDRLKEFLKQPTCEISPEYARKLLVQRFPTESPGKIGRIRRVKF